MRLIAINGRSVHSARTLGSTWADCSAASCSHEIVDHLANRAPQATEIVWAEENNEAIVLGSGRHLAPKTHPALDPRMEDASCRKRV